MSAGEHKPEQMAVLHDGFVTLTEASLDVNPDDHVSLFAEFPETALSHSQSKRREAMKTVQVENAKSVVDITIDELARAFWSLDSCGQADFLDELAAVIQEDHKENPCAYSLCEMQWCYLKDELRKPGRERANQMHMAFSAFAYDFVSQKPDGCRAAEEGI